MHLLARPCLAALTTLCASGLLQPQGAPFRVVDRNQQAPASYDFGSIRGGKLVGSFAVFLADDGAETRVWRTDGTSNGTFVLARIAGAHASGATIEIAGALDRAYFVGPDLGTGTVLWATDGTPGGTAAVGGSGRTPMSLAADATDGSCWFSATDASNGRELWHSDGTAANTVRVTQLRSGSLDGMLAQPRQIAPLPSGVFFAGQNATSGVELWRLSGVALSLFANLAAGTASSSPREFCWSGDYSMFRADGGNGSEPYCIALGVLQTIDLWPGASSSAPTDFVAYQPNLTQPLFWFAAATPTQGRELIRYNPFGQTTTVVDVLPGGDSNARPLLQCGSRVLFVVFGFLFGVTYYSVPGTGTTFTQLASSYNLVGTVGRITASPGRCVVRVENPFDNYLLQRSDGTVAGTVTIENGAPTSTVVAEFPGNLGALLEDGRAVYATGAPVPLVPGGITAGSSPDRLASMEDGTVVYCSAGLPCRSDGTVAGSQSLLGSGVQTGAFSPRFGGHRYFVATTVGTRLYRTDGTAGGTSIVGVVANGSTVHWLTTPTQLLLFLGNNLYATDGSTAPVLVHSGLPPAPAPAALGNVVLFRGQDAATGVELWRTDGTAAGTFLVRDTRTGPPSGLGTGSEPQWSLRARPGQLLFAADDGAGDEVWRTDGTAAGTSIVTAIAPGGGGALISFGPLTADGRVLFAATSPTTGRDLWSTDGTFAGTQLLTDDAIANSAAVLGFVGGQWLYTLGDATSARLYGTSGTAATTTLVTNLAAGGLPRSGARIATYGSNQDGIALFGLGSALWRTDGQGPTTYALAVGSSLSEPTQFCTLPGADRAVFAASTVGFGREPWRSGGFAIGGNFTVRLADIHPGNGSSDPQEFTPSGGLVFFTADDGSSGRELWAMPTFPAVFAYGQGCPGTAGLVPSIAAGSPARLGGALQVRLAQALPASIALRSLGLAGLDVPLGNGCFALTDAIVTDAAITSPTGTLQLDTTIPNDPAVVGLSIHAQFAVLDPNGAFAGLLALSGGLRALVGR